MVLKLGENLRNLRKDRGITQEELAYTLGVSFQAISKWERGESYPDISILPTLAGYFGVTIENLMGVNRMKTEKEWHDFGGISAMLRQRLLAYCTNTRRRRFLA